MMTNMYHHERLLNQHEAAAATALAVTVVRYLAENDVLNPAHGYAEADLAELRRVHRLIEDLPLDQPAVEVVAAYAAACAGVTSRSPADRKRTARPTAHGADRCRCRCRMDRSRLTRWIKDLTER